MTRGIAALLLLIVGASPAAAVQKKNAPREVHVRTLDVVVRDGLAYTAQTSALVVHDVAEPGAPEKVGQLTLPTTVAGIELWDDLALLAAGSHGLYVVDVSDPAKPVRVVRHDTPGSTRQVLRHDRYAYLADGAGGLRVVDLRSPDRPRQRSTFATRNQLRAMSLDGERLAVAEGTAGVRVFDVRRPDAPREWLELTAAEGALDVALRGDLLLVAEGRRGVGIYRLAGSRPERLAGIPPLDSATRVLLVGSHALVANGAGGLQIVDVEDPERPAVLSETPLPRGYPAGRMHLDGDVLYIAADVAGLAVLDLANRLEPRVLLPRERKMKVIGP
jgi:hypothetical protein